MCVRACLYVIEKFCFLVKNSSCYCHQLWIPQLHVESFKNFGYTGNPVCNFNNYVYTYNICLYLITLIVSWYLTSQCIVMLCIN